MLRFIPRPYCRNEFIVAYRRKWVGVIYKTFNGWRIAGDDSRRFDTKLEAGNKLAILRAPLELPRLARSPKPNLEPNEAGEICCPSCGRYVAEETYGPMECCDWCERGQPE